MVGTSQVLKRVVDALDVETFLLCRDEEEGRALIQSLLKDMGFEDVDVVFAQHVGHGARLRARAYVHRPGDHYGWLEEESS
jgi:hypothetical protein